MWQIAVIATPADWLFPLWASEEHPQRLLGLIAGTVMVLWAGIK